MHTIQVKSTRRQELIDISSHVAKIVDEHGSDKKLCIVFVPHTTAAVTINENADPDVKDDIIHALDLLVPLLKDFKHVEGNSDAHVKASLLGSAQSIPVINRRLALGTWQGIFLAEFDGPRSRRVLVQLV